ncbi:MAG: hypothetical protein ACI9BD_000832, partial [Candidatus Marinamargulisbacteria bacterium]
MKVTGADAPEAQPEIVFDKGVSPGYSTAAHTSTSGIRIAGVGANYGLRAADDIIVAGDVLGTIDRITYQAFNALFVADLRAAYDVLIITWATHPALNADWATRIKPYLELGGGVIWEDPTNMSDLAPFVTLGSWTPGSFSLSAVVPGLTDGVTSAWSHTHMI